MGGKTQAGYFLCRDCADKFTCRTGTVMERSHIPLHKWLMAMMLMSSSKKGMSAHQLHRMLGITYKSAWFLCHRIREAMNEAVPTGGLGGEGKIVEVDETYVGGKAINRAHGKPSPKKAVVSLVERDGRARSFHVATVTAKTVRSLIVTHVNRKSTLMSDEANFYSRVGSEFAAHHAVDHTRKEYAYADLPTGRTVSINVSENFDLEARNHGNLSLDQRGAFAPLPLRVRFPIQQSLKARGRGRGARCARVERYRRQATNL
jgi:hypothetical protein